MMRMRPRNCDFLLLAAGLLSMAAAASAGTAADPTRPPAQWLAAKASDPAAIQEQPRVTQVIVHSEGRKLAIVDGVLVRVGETYNGDRLMTIRRNEVIWKRGPQPEADTPRPPIIKKIIESGAKQ